jgi:hypothetical protein
LARGEPRGVLGTASSRRAIATLCGSTGSTTGLYPAYVAYSLNKLGYEVEVNGVRLWASGGFDLAFLIRMKLLPSLDRFDEQPDGCGRTPAGGIEIC